MKVLFVAGGVPYPPDTGGRLRTYNLLKRLSKLHDITLVAYEPQDRVPDEAISEMCSRLVLVPRPDPSGRLRMCRDLITAPFMRDPLIVTKYRSGVLTHTLASLIARDDSDLIHCDSVSVADSVAEAAGTPHCMGTHNVEAQIWLRHAEVERNPIKKAYILSQCAKVRRFEMENYSRFRRCLVVSEDDKRLMREWYGLDSTVIPNGVDPDYFHPNAAAPEPFNIAFFGSMDWRPNQDAVHYFHEEIWPRVKAAMPAASFTVVGRKPPASILRLSESDGSIRVTGTVDDVRPYLWRATLTVVPLRIGGGSRLKILESLSACKPVVATTVATEGLEGVGDWVTIEDRPHAFAERIVELLAARHKSPDDLTDARNFVATHYSWDAAANHMDRAWSTG
ncbi:MAG: glycosyltransferase family 4 protein [Armatimonadetes bacterium]|nr:glycosyltransferase family 4 protein [Armatimonadota bacterium]